MFGAKRLQYNLCTGVNILIIYNEWPPHCLSKRQVLATTVLFRTTSTRTIKHNLLKKWLLDSNLLQFIMRQVQRTQNVRLCSTCDNVAVFKVQKSFLLRFNKIGTKTPKFLPLHPCSKERRNQRERIEASWCWNIFLDLLDYIHCCLLSEILNLL